MSFFSNTPQPTEPAVPLSATLPDARTSAPIPNNSAVASAILTQPFIGEYKRQVVTWRTPHLGYVQMYLNPQQIRIEDRKIVSADRTKGGYVIQYAGEALTQIAIDGTTGSSGIEGINVLRSIYRSEHEAFEGIAVGLDDALSNLQVSTLANNLLDQSPLSFLGDAFSMVSDVFRNFGRPQPTLASLASNIEMYFQGEIFRGFFESFSVNERADSPGWFDYQIMFKAYARQGRRHNFMPWHREPYNPADVNANPLSYTGAADILNAFSDPPTQPVGAADAVNLTSQSIKNDATNFTKLKSFGRNVSTAAGINGRNVNERNLLS